MPSERTPGAGRRGRRWLIPGLLAVLALLTGCSPGSRPTADTAQSAVVDHPVRTTGCGHAVADHTITRTLRVNGLTR